MVRIKLFPILWKIFIVAASFNGLLTIFIWTQFHDSRQRCRQCPDTGSFILGPNFAGLGGLRYTYKRQEPHKDARGSLNIHRWEQVCGITIDSLRGHSFFPNLPNYRSSVDSLKLPLSRAEHFGQRIFGYIHPPSTGFYQFAISSDDFSEFWLSSDDDPKHCKMICYVGGAGKRNYAPLSTKPGDFNKYKTQKSERIHLEGGGKYFLEVLHKQSIRQAHLHVMWKLPESKKYENIPRKFLSQYMEEHAFSVDSYHGVLKQHKTSKTEYFSDNNGNVSWSSNNRTRLRYLRKYHTRLPNCGISEEKPKIKLRRYQGVKQFVRIANVYPNDHSAIIIEHCQSSNNPNRCRGNPLQQKENASQIINQYLNETLPTKYSLTSIIGLEEFVRINSSREQIKHYFVDVEVTDKSSGEVLRIAEPVWEQTKDGKLCRPAGRSWNSDVMVYVIVTAKNQGVWVRHFIDTIEYIQEGNNDYNIHPIIVDFGSKDVGPNDTEIYLKRSKLKHYTVIHKSGAFYKTAAINEAAASVKDNSSILFQLDLHLDLPLNLIDTVRKHTIQGEVGFTPFLMRLACGSSTLFRYGVWEDVGYGLFAVYKSDWVRFGGMNVKAFRYKWGGEDWEMIDRVVMNNIEVHTRKMMGLYHHYHDRKHLWENSD